MLDASVFSYAFLIGFVPVLIWLGFWLLQDRKHPEPRSLILRAFAAGMLCVVLVIPLQQVVNTLFPVGFVLILLWAALEEIMKLGLTWFVVLRNRAVDEPVDVVIYLITTALGFAALENTLFLITTLTNGEIGHGLITGNLRFIGATLIHVLSTATIGVFLAFSFFKNNLAKFLYGVVGVILATLLHALFNFSIINTSADWLLTIFAGVWVGVVFLLLVLEKVKLLKRPAWWEKMFIKK